MYGNTGDLKFLKGPEESGTLVTVGNMATYSGSLVDTEPTVVGQDHLVWKT